MSTPAAPLRSSPDPSCAAVRLRDAPRLQLTRGQLRGASWERLSHGLHAPARDHRPLAELAAMVASVLPRDSGYGHLTSAALRGWWLPFRLAPHVLLATTTSGVHVQRRGLYVRRSRHAEFEQVAGVTCVSGTQTLVELARDLNLVDLVPIVDCALASGTDPEALLAAARPRTRGATKLRRAVALADARSESWWESILRLQHTLTGLGPVESQVEVTTDTGLVVARADLHLVGTNRYPECDGGEHRTMERHGHDLRRDKAMSRLDVQRYGYTTNEIARQPNVVIRDAEDARGLPHDERRGRAWWRQARTSTLTAHGRTRLQARLERYRLAAQRRVAPSGRPGAS
jgi:hypothetical protein